MVVQSNILATCLLINVSLFSLIREMTEVFLIALIARLLCGDLSFGELVKPLLLTLFKLLWRNLREK